MSPRRACERVVGRRPMYCTAPHNSQRSAAATLSEPALRQSAPAQLESARLCGAPAASRLPAMKWSPAYGSPQRSTTCSAALLSLLGSESPLSYMDSMPRLAQITSLFSCTLSNLTAEENVAAATAAVTGALTAAGDAVSAVSAPEPEEEEECKPSTDAGELAAALCGVRILSGSADRTLRVWDPSLLAEGAPAAGAVLHGVRSACAASWLRAPKRKLTLSLSCLLSPAPKSTRTGFTRCATWAAATAPPAATTARCGCGL